MEILNEQSRISAIRFGKLWADPQKLYILRRTMRLPRSPGAQIQPNPVPATKYTLAHPIRYSIGRGIP
ncbi:hypothetical protein V6Z11_D09G151800 [Gossypium hirsutum]